MSDADLRELDELRRLGEELRATYVAERRAIGQLDHAQLEFLAARKQQIADQLSRARVAPTPELRALFEALRVEGQATAMLAATASAAVRALLGRDDEIGYDRRANRTTTGTTRNLAAL